MKKLLLLLILSVATLQPVSAQSYRGFADIEAGCFINIGTAPLKAPLFGITTTHGIQLAEKFFIGAGTGILISTLDLPYADFSANRAMPFYADFRFDWWTGKKANPFIDLKLGGTITQSGGFLGKGFYLNPTIGIRMRLTNRMGINLGLSYSCLQSAGYYECSEHHRKSQLENAISIKAGIDF